ncbi:DUF5658 family protein [Gottschalkia acidurici]|uniref:DUF5658 family protein n=1 Tax=Clostridium acidurici TaxID=1556 RepID=UPI0005A03DBA|nr:DUF5658 family protein [Gottschalkia acidurici]
MILNILDLISTKIAINLGAAEVNPIMSLIVDSKLFIIVKILVPIAISLWLYRKSKYNYNRVLLTSKTIVGMYVFVVT